MVGAGAGGASSLSMTRLGTSLATTAQQSLIVAHLACACACACAWGDPLLVSSVRALYLGCPKRRPETRFLLQPARIGLGSSLSLSPFRSPRIPRPRPPSLRAASGIRRGPGRNDRANLPGPPTPPLWRSDRHAQSTHDRERPGRSGSIARLVQRRKGALIFAKELPCRCRS